MSLDPQAVPRPLLDLIEVAVVRVDRAVCVLVEVNVVGFGSGMAEAWPLPANMGVSTDRVAFVVRGTYQTSMLIGTKR
jgi:hypothetical protein